MKQKFNFLSAILLTVMSIYAVNSAKAAGDIDPNLIFTLTVSEPGTLQREFVGLEADEVQGLVIKGKLNSDDLIYLNSGTGRMASVKYLDLSEITLDYDGKQYSSRTDAPEAGMGTKYNYYYILSEENYDETLPFSFVLGYSTNRYRNNLAYVFYKNKVLETVVLPAWMNSIGEGIMCSCASLKSVTLPPVLTEIGESAFGSCASLKSVTLPPVLTEIGKNAFGWCSSLTITEIPSSIKKIGKYAFQNVTIKQDKLQFDAITIGDGAFSDCKGFSSLEITNPDDTIKSRTFAKCLDLKEIKFGEGLKYIGDDAFKNCGITSVDFPESFEEIGYNTFLNCPFISSLPEEGNIRYLGSIAYELSDRTLDEYTVRDGTLMLAPELFRHAENQPRINLPESIEILGQRSLSGCNFTTTPDLPNLRRIGEWAFEDCPLTTVVIPEKVTLIHHNAFSGCDKIWKLNYNAINAEIVINGYSLFDNPIEKITLGDKVQHIPSGLCIGSNITEITLPASVTSIGERAFQMCSKLEYINSNDNITEIGESAFNGCSSLSNIHWPAKLKTVGVDAFRNCTTLKTVSLPEGMESVGGSAFIGCDGVENLYIASTITEFGSSWFRHYAETPLTITVPFKTPSNIIRLDLGGETPVTFKVPAASLDLYKNDANWNRPYGVPPLIIPIETISAPKEETETSFDKGIESDTDLGDTVLGDVYVTIGEEDGYDETDGSIVLNSSMNEEYADAIGGMAPGESDLANRFNGLVVQVPAGTGIVTINCLTIGTKRVSVKIGDAAPLYYTKDSKGDITIDYIATEDTYVYIYASETESETEQQVRSRSASAGDNSVKIYSIGVRPITLGIDEIDAYNEELSPVTDYFRVDGTRVETPTIPGIYIARHANGKSSKVLVK